jgi:iron complex outermembrane receptor protein
MGYKKAIFLSSTTAMLGLGNVGTAYAQSALNSSAAAPTTAEGAKDGGITDIVVTAQKRSESSQKVPVTVTALSGATLKESGVKDLRQAALLVPGIVFSLAPDDGLALTFRGLGTVARSQAFELSTATFIDGTFLGKGRLITTSFFDVSQMEFIKGTQSTLLGKNASLGAVSVVTNQPTDKLSFEGSAGYQVKYGGYTTDGVVNVPLSPTIALRVAGHYNDLNGTVHNDLTNHDGPEAKDTGIRATLRGNLTENLTVTGSYQYANNVVIGTGYKLIATGLSPALGNTTLDGDLSQYTPYTSSGEAEHHTRSHLASMKAELAIGDHKLIAQSSFIAYKLGYVDNFSFSPEHLITFERNEKYHQFSQELRLQSPATGRLQYMAGLYYLGSHWDSSENQLWAVPGIPGPPIPGVADVLFNGSYNNHYVSDNDTYSAFASGSFELAPGLKLAGGARVTRETKDIVYGRTTIGALTVWNTIANPPFAPTPLQWRSTFFDGNVNLDYQIDRNVMVYAAFGHGSKAGGYAETNTIAVPPPVLVNGLVPASLVAAGAEVKDEFTKTYEVGLKSKLFEGHMVFNLTGFLTTAKDFQDTVFTGGSLGFITFNGPARSIGVEVQSAYRVDQHLSLNGSFTYANATQVLQPIDASGNPEVDGSGNPIYGTYRRSQAPKVVFNAGANYKTPISDTLDMTLNANVRHRSSMFNQRQEQYPSQALTTLDLSAGIDSSNRLWGVELLAKNVTNSISEDFASPTIDPRYAATGGYLASPTAKRTVMISFHFKY